MRLFKKKMLGILMGLTMAIAIIPAMSVKVNAAVQQPVRYLDPVVSEGTVTFEEKTCTEYKQVTDQTTSLDGGWYVVEGDVTLPDTLNQLYVNKTTNLILCDNARLEINCKVICEYSENQKLNIYAQSRGDNAGRLVAKDGIKIPGNITINGGNITASSDDRDGIASRNIVINGGNITASSVDKYGIAAYYMGLTVNGGRVTASSVKNVAIFADGADIALHGGEVTAKTSNTACEAIFTHCDIIIDGADVTQLVG